MSFIKSCFTILVLYVFMPLLKSVFCKKMFLRLYASLKIIVLQKCPFTTFSLIWYTPCGCFTCLRRLGNQAEAMYLCVRTEFHSIGLIAPRQVRMYLCYHNIKLPELLVLLLFFFVFFNGFFPGVSFATKWDSVNFDSSMPS